MPLDLDAYISLYDFAQAIPFSNFPSNYTPSEILKLISSRRSSFIIQTLRNIYRCISYIMRNNKAILSNLVNLFIREKDTQTNNQKH